MKVIEQRTAPDGGQYVVFKCPACDESVVIPVSQAGGTKPTTWGFNGNLEKPTLTPSILQTKGDGDPYRCHFFVTDGVFHFCADSNHAMAGKSVPMVELGEIGCGP